MVDSTNNSTPGNSAAKPIRRRKTGPARRLEIARVAAELFASEGFSVSTRRISSELNITQAALYKHFKSKDELIEEVFRVNYLDNRVSNFAELAASTKTPIEESLTLAYTDFLDGITSTSLRLFQRGSYDGLALAKRYSPHLDKRILEPTIEALRNHLGLAALSVVSITKDERDIALMLHSTIVFLAIRKFVYHIDFEGNEQRLINLHIRTWLPGASVLLASLHEK